MEKICAALFKAKMKGKTMAYYNVCPNCGSNLDPGESCECKSTSETAQKISKKENHKDDDT